MRSCWVGVISIVRLSKFHGYEWSTKKCKIKFKVLLSKVESLHYQHSTEIAEIDVENLDADIVIDSYFDSEL